MKKVRADVLVVEQGLCATRNQAQRLILAGRVRRGPDAMVRKPGELLKTDCELRLDSLSPYVSRGAEKLLPALRYHRPDLTDRIALDIGASTGGFTDLLLRHGVARVYAVDVGYGQLHRKLRQDQRVICLERINARYLNTTLIPEKIEVMTVDVSFISLRKILPATCSLLQPGAWIFLLIKPQFEAERHEIGKGGVVRDEAVQKRCIEAIATFAISSCGWIDLGAIPSPLTGPKGNQEYILTLRIPEE